MAGHGAFSLSPIATRPDTLRARALPCRVPTCLDTSPQTAVDAAFHLVLRQGERVSVSGIGACAPARRLRLRNMRAHLGQLLR
jgi:hypothetical protein